MAKSVKRSRYKNTSFLKTLGEHCRKLRTQRGYSIDRLAKESEQLSSSNIDRLERGLADTQILVLVRYAEALGLSLIDLFSFLKDAPQLQKDSRILPYEEGIKVPADFVAVYSLKVAAGNFSTSSEVQSTPIGWIEAGIKGSAKDYFACFINGESMSPRIENGSLALFKKYQGGSRQGKIFLIQARGLRDTETGESFVVKKYMRQTAARTEAQDGPAVIHLISENPRFPAIVLVGLSDDEIQTIAEFVRVL